MEKTMTKLMRMLVLLVTLIGVPVAVAVPASASPLAPAATGPGGAALDWAEANALGHWYGWGGTGPTYDCSGLVYESVLQADGITLPRTTYGMMASPHLTAIPLSQAQRGDLLFYGSGHVEFATDWNNVSFGAQQTGTQVGWHTWNAWWAPTMAYRLS